MSSQLQGFRINLPHPSGNVLLTEVENSVQVLVWSSPDLKDFDQTEIHEPWPKE